MKLKPYVLICALCGALSFQSCSNDDDPVAVPDAVNQTFSAKYPNATNPKWEDKAGYKVADFWENNEEKDAWFDQSGNWVMTETEYNGDQTKLPQAILAALQASEYGAWRVDDIDKYERPNAETFYRIEVEKGGQPERNLFYSESGVLLNDVVDNDDDDILPDTPADGGNLPTELTQAVKDAFGKKFPDAQLRELEREGLYFVVDFTQGGLEQEAWYTQNAEWVMTETDYGQQKAKLPQAVQDAFAKGNYSAWTVDDIDCFERAADKFYRIEVESGKQEFSLFYDEAGKLLKEAPDTTNDDVTPDFKL